MSEVSDRVFFRIGKTYEIEKYQEVLEKEDESERDRIHRRLSAFRIERVIVGKTEESYQTSVLNNIAKILGFSPSGMHKADLVSEIQRRWREYFPEDFEK